MQVLAGVGAAPFAATGGTTQDVGSYRYHIFTSDDTFTPNGNGTVEAFLVAGGGGGWSGGGGGGGVITFTSSSVTGGTAYSVDVGAGSATTQSNGSDSTFNSLTAVGGGAGGVNGNGSAGGSGGGGRYGGYTGGAATSGQGNIGGVGRCDSPLGAAQSAGGGGYGGVGLQQNCSSAYGRGDGGTGYALSNVADFASLTVFSGMTHVASGGGGRGDDNYGGTSGIGGPGAGNGNYGGNNPSSWNATWYGCGGGGGTSSSYGYGYQGIVIIRYAKPV